MSWFKRKKDEGKDDRSIYERSSELSEQVKQLAMDCNHRDAIFMHITSVPRGPGMDNTCLIVGEAGNTAALFAHLAQNNKDFAQLILETARKIKNNDFGGDDKVPGMIKDALARLKQDLKDRTGLDVETQALDITEGTDDLPEDMPEILKNAIRGLKNGQRPIDGIKNKDIEGFNDDLDEFD